MENVQILIYSQDSAFCQRVERYLALWSESLCVRCAPMRREWGELRETDLSDTIAFLDLNGAAAEGMDGYEDRPPRGAAAIVVSDDETQAIQAYRWHPAACLPADFGYAAFCGAMDQCFPFWRQGLQWLDLPFQREQVRLPLCQIRYAEADGRETLLHCAGGVIRVGLPLGKTADLLPSPPFLRCQKSFVVHIGAILAFSNGELTMSDGKTILIARERVRELENTITAWKTVRGADTE